MAPTKSTPASKAGKSPSKPKEPRDSDLKKQLLFLWACHKISGVQVDAPAVARHFGITNHAARMRLDRLRKKLDEMEASTRSDDDTRAIKDKDDDCKAQTKQTEVDSEDECDTMSD
ncbi:hypothetical protein DTO013E5_6243 [Penicillium roqueforti]|uniref:Myb-like DNA-binding domain-containing protein n=1 Tax=Penicillium roqueforti (strain FM164) TaxID=1365484 RepID=W6R783_PENRF|nr:uncharacterized protein LCP9604111_5208 [Penicillium roqueforti]CDM37702.1 unnamed protein product [Penicillium roqueforti FM164]KAF9248458.1 hypothetical protein LCP9604111_5208 [Penicillium roqueforti]KAI1831095.1 hypothetical protein CBS147337_8161 [Penicillium roqueforti]KAI2674055.1 hypothetical protein CBS147355_7230 [Penicillium roqueforti]KAI2682180.1 hypothetical protein LCP963914a_6595 [Penicillium roqueforti]